MKTIPAHLYWARKMVDDILAGNVVTFFKNGCNDVKWYDSKNRITGRSVADCSCFVSELLNKSYGVNNLIFFSKPKAEDYFRLIQNEKYFFRINQMEEIREGDFIVFLNSVQYKKSNNNPHTGHIMIVNKKPKKVISTYPIVPNTTQWIINVIDQTGDHGVTDLRYYDPFKKGGLGTGDIKLYTDKSGELLGMCWSADGNNRFRDLSDRPVVIGRLCFC